MSVTRQYGVHELPGTEQPAPGPAKTTVSAGFELQMRGYVNAIWAKVAELEGKVDGFEGWRDEVALFLKERAGIDPRVSPRPLLAAAASGGEGSRLPASPRKPRGRKPGPRPWLAEGVSRRTYFRRKLKEGAP